MRTIQTFVLRLLVDADELGTLRGSLRSVATDKGGAFADARALLDLLRRMVAQPARTRRAENNRTNEDSQVRQPDEQQNRANQQSDS